jgi:ubiquinone/menaquinone biosynthesis C-methylase UbiE
MSEPKDGTPTAEERFKKYFTLMAPNYGRFTGNSTRDILSEILFSHGTAMAINGSSTILDNAAGPGTATEAIINWCSTQNMSHLPRITATDFVPAMIDATNAIKAKDPKWEGVTAQVMDSQTLTFSSNTFTHIFCNFSIFTFTRPKDVLKEIHRTLKPKGIAVVSCWKHFGVDQLMRAAQKLVKGDEYASSLKMAGPEFTTQGYLAGMVEEAGWERGKIRTLEVSTLITGENLAGLVEFMSGNFVAPALVGWTDEEKSKWPEAVVKATEQETQKHGGLKLESWVVLARKWDELYG